MGVQDTNRQMPVALVVLAALLAFALLWTATFYATGLVWWHAPDHYGARTPRPVPVTVPADESAPVESAPESSR